MNSLHSSRPIQSRIPTYSWFFEVWITQKQNETRVKKSVYFNHERWYFYAVSDGDVEAKFRGPEGWLEIVWYVENGEIKFPISRNSQYVAMETIHPMSQSALVPWVNESVVNLLQSS